MKLRYERIATLLRELADEFEKLIDTHPTIKIEDLEFSVRTRNALSNDSIYTLDELIAHTRVEVAGLPNCGSKSMKEIDEVLTNLNVSFRR